MPYIKYLWWRPLQLQAIDVDLGQKLGPILIQCEIYGFHKLVLERLRTAPHLPEYLQRVVYSLHYMLLSVHEGLGLDLLKLRLTVNLVLGPLVIVGIEQAPERGPLILFDNILVKVTHLERSDIVRANLLRTASLRNQVLRRVHLLHVIVRNILLLGVLRLLNHLIHRLVLVEALAVALEAGLDLLINVLNLFDDPLLQAVELDLSIVFNVLQNLLRLLTVLLVLLEDFVRYVQVLADLSQYAFFAWHLFVICELKHN